MLALPACPSAGSGHGVFAAHSENIPHDHRRLRPDSRVAAEDVAQHAKLSGFEHYVLQGRHLLPPTRRQPLQRWHQPGLGHCASGSAVQDVVAADAIGHTNKLKANGEMPWQVETNCERDRSYLVLPIMVGAWGAFAPLTPV